MIVAGNHVYERCGYCQKLVRMTGWFAGLHICSRPEERARIDAAGAREQMRNQQRTFSENISAQIGREYWPQGSVGKEKW